MEGGDTDQCPPLISEFQKRRVRGEKIAVERDLKRTSTPEGFQ